MAMLSIFFMAVMVLMTIAIGIRAKEKAELQTMADLAAWRMSVTTSRAFNAFSVLNRVAIAHWIAVGSVNAGGLVHQILLENGNTSSTYNDPYLDQQSQRVFEALRRIETMQGWVWFNLMYNTTRSDTDARSVFYGVTNTWFLNPSIAPNKNEYIYMGSMSCREVCHATTDFRGDIFGWQDADIRESYLALMGSRLHPLAAGLEADGTSYANAYNTGFTVMTPQETTAGPSGPWPAPGSGGLWTSMEARSQFPSGTPSVHSIRVTSSRGGYQGNHTPNHTPGAALGSHEIDTDPISDWITLFENDDWDTATRLAQPSLKHRVDNRNDRGYGDDANNVSPRTLYQGFVGFIDYTAYPAGWPSNPPDYSLIGCSNTAGNNCMKGPWDAYGMPKLSMGIKRDYGRRAFFNGRAPWEILFTFNLSSTSDGRFSSTPALNSASQAPGGEFTNQVALAAGMAYYHRRPAPNVGTNTWEETPNMLNPFWRATLVPMDIDQHGKPPANFSSTKDTFRADNPASPDHQALWATGFRPGDVGNILMGWAGNHPELTDYYDEFVLKTGRYRGVH